MERRHADHRRQPAAPGQRQGRAGGLRADTGEQLWSAPTQTGIIAPPVSYTVDGEQYVAVMVGWGGALGLAGGIAPREGDQVGGRLLAFKLGGRRSLPPAPPPPALPQPPAQTASADTIAKGHALYHAYCSVCHGLNAESPTLADLRYMQPATHELFDKIVLDGLYKDLGMVGWSKYLSADDAACHPRLRDRAGAPDAARAGRRLVAVRQGLGLRRAGQAGGLVHSADRLSGVRLRPAAARLSPRCCWRAWPSFPPQAGRTMGYHRRWW